MSRWLSAREVDSYVKDFDKKQELFDLHALSLFCSEAFLCSDFEPSSSWLERVILTKHAKDYLEDMHRNGVKSKEAWEIFILFSRFFHHDLFVDHINTDAEAVRVLLNEMHNTGQAKWPYVFGNELYHKFNDSFSGNITDRLDASAVDSLLRGTPQGVFQVGKLISGPLGFIRGQEERIVSPTLRMPLWHCSDPGCQARHFVRLEKAKSPFQAASDALTEYILDTFGYPSEWDRPIANLCADKWPDSRLYSDLPAIIGDCIIGGERTALVRRCIQSYHNNLLTNTLLQAGRSEVKPRTIAELLTPEEQHQLLLLVPDGDLIRYIDELVAQKVIRVPPTELRSGKTYAPKRERDARSRLSSLGIRSKAHPPILELAASVWSCYESLGMTDDLVWRLRSCEGASFRHSFMEFNRAYGPRRAVKELVLSSRAVTTAISKRLNLQFLEGESEENTINRLLWKFGFNLARYEDAYQILRNRLADFHRCVLQAGPRLAEPEKAKIRGLGANLFVSVESFLEDLMCYNVWLLSSDHFTGTRFRFARSDAQKSVLETLGSEITSRGEAFRWSLNGLNTLGTLLTYLQAYRVWLRERATGEKTKLVREEKDYPHYVKDEVFVFPFRHTALWADVEPQIMAVYVEMIEKICKQLGQANLANVRNGLDHKREDDAFPTLDEMLICVTRLQDVVEIADDGRLIPKLYWITRGEYERQDMLRITLEDYRGNTVSLWEPSLVVAIPKKSFGVPYLVAPLDFFNQPNAMLVFTVRSRSEYSEYWKDWPRRRFIPSTTEGELGEFGEGLPVDSA